MNKSLNIVLVGLMGCGKTSVGKLVATKLNLTFIDIDDIIEKTENKLISKIFETDGETYFRKIEVETIAKYSQYNSQVISTGGGAPQNPLNIENLKSNGILFYLYAPVEVLYKRLLNEIDNRPMLHTENPQNKLMELLNKREPYYLQSHYKIDTSDKTITEVSNELIKIYQGAPV